MKVAYPKNGESHLDFAWRVARVYAKMHGKLKAKVFIQGVEIKSLKRLLGIAK